MKLKLRDLYNKLSSSVQGIRIQQVQLINASDWEDKYKQKANKCWEDFNEALEELYKVLEDIN